MSVLQTGIGPEKGAGNRKTHTLSVWFKRAEIAASNEIFCSYVNDSNRVFIRNNGNIFEFQHFIGGTSYSIQTSQEFRDPSAWYHLIYAVDTAQATAADRIKIYINGQQVTAFSTEQYPPQNSDLSTNNTGNHYLGSGEFNNSVYSNYWDGYLAEINFIDGQALDPTSFGEFKSGVWVANEYFRDYSNDWCRR